MTEVHTTRVLSDPFKIARHLYVLVPFLGDKLFFVDNYRDKIITEKRFNEYLKDLNFKFLSAPTKKNAMLRTACSYILNKKIVGGVEIYHRYHHMERQSRCAGN